MKRVAIATKSHSARTNIRKTNQAMPAEMAISGSGTERNAATKPPATTAAKRTGTPKRRAFLSHNARMSSKVSARTYSRLTTPLIPSTTAVVSTQPATATPSAHHWAQPCVIHASRRCRLRTGTIQSIP